MIHRLLLTATMALITTNGVQGGVTWPLWERYAAHFIDSQGRVIDHDTDGRTTSEGQSYALFFAYVAGDVPRFDQLLRWTELNLAEGDLKTRLPAWLWGKRDDNTWGVRDRNSASDADLWIAYTLLEAGEEWRRPELSVTGQRLLRLAAEKEVADVPGLGMILLPGVDGFRTSHDRLILNPSYMPLQLLLRFAAADPAGPWQSMAARVPGWMRHWSPKGFPLDWVSYETGHGFKPEDPQGRVALSSYDAIRVYLWAGMLDPATKGRREMLAALSGMIGLLKKNPIPPAEVTHNGIPKPGHASVGFAASLIPFLQALDEQRMAAEQLKRLAAEWNPTTGLYGSEPHYYDQNLALFSTGWSDRRFGFGADGCLKVSRRQL